MPETSARLSLPLIQAAQAQKHVTHNEALILLDALVQLVVEAFSATTPPAAPDDGEVWALGPDPTGAWAGQGGKLAARANGGWLFIAPQAGWRAAQGTDARVFDGADWVQLELPALQNLDGVGIGTIHDGINRLAVAAEATLLTHDGAGHQLKINKDGVSDTASLLFQSGWSGRAEFGLAGSDDFSVKVSPDGATWHDVLVADRASGALTLGQPLPPGSGGTGAVTAAGARTNLGLGTAATANVTTSSTDTTAGRVLRTGDFGYGVEREIAGGSANDLLVPGKYNWSNSGAPSDLPISTAQGGTVEVLYGRFVFYRQVYHQRNTGRSWTRSGEGNPVVWEPWAEIFNAQSILGTVSQTGGVPTGAVIQRGSNANGRFMRLADGTQICWRTKSASNNAAATWTFPAAFAAVPTVIGTARATVLSSVCLDAAPTTTAATFSARDKEDTRRADTVHLTAVGRWF